MSYHIACILFAVHCCCFTFMCISIHESILSIFTILRVYTFKHVISCQIVHSKILRDFHPFTEIIMIFSFPTL